MHRLIWETFVGKIPYKLQINHKDCNKENNDYKTNLEIVTQVENMKHAIDNKLIWTKEHRKKQSLMAKKSKFWENAPILKGKDNSNYGKFGEESSNHKLSNEEARMVRKFRFIYKWPYKKIAKKLNVSIGCVNGIINGYSFNPNNLSRAKILENFLKEYKGELL